MTKMLTPINIITLVLVLILSQLVCILFFTLKILGYYVHYLLHILSLYHTHNWLFKKSHHQEEKENNSNEIL